MEQNNKLKGLKCLFCGRFFRRTQLGRGRQKSCTRPDCQRKRKQEQNKRWRCENPDYFHGRYENTKLWRAAHPGYQKRWRDKRSHEIQALTPSPSPVKSIRCHLRGVGAIDEIQALTLTVKHDGNEIWVERAA